MYARGHFSPCELMQFHSIKAIVIKSIPYQDSQKILTLFSGELGIASMIIKGLSSKGSHKLPFTMPFCEAEFVFSKGKSDLLLFQEGSIINLNLPLRDNLSNLQTAFCLCQILMPLQLPGKPAPHLYALLSTFLRQIPLFSCPKILVSCFKLKILLHEGLYHPEEKEDSLSNIEKKIIEQIALVTTFTTLKELQLPLEVFYKIEGLFLERTNNF